ncbi:hypothetical protein AS156_29320 [Bradyrhizobium macuxiense]|uniref:Uncharacterized protein n=1 Tax=Bradyrhizobium macuxiense TaxID=1755647 RepID=A0A109K494_9BRAD|nr:hypothetical protein AS156_29320 [Bradyrhizobium macuxiense]
MPHEPPDQGRRHRPDPKDTAGKMADAVSYLCRVAVEEGLEIVVPDLLGVRRKLEEIANSECHCSGH